VAKSVGDMAETCSLRDVWQTERGFTWRRPNTDCFSCIDRILYSGDTLELVSVAVDWSINCSDHAAVVATFSYGKGITRPRTRLTRLDPLLIKDPNHKLTIENKLDEMMALVDPNWDPHLKLEYAKMSIRTVTERLQADLKVKSKTEEDEINEELNSAINQIERQGLARQEILDYIEELRRKKEAIIEEKGRKLAEKLRTKWFNEGEKSTKYFMRLLNRRAPDTFKKIVREDESEVVDETGIEKEIVTFYKNLYENYEKVNIAANDDEAFFQKLESVSEADDEDVAKPITVDELRETLHSCKDSAPGLDGIPYSYLGGLWNTMGKLIVDAWNYSLQIRRLPPSHKVSLLKLIPKAGKDLTKLTNWRPISLSNCDHKLITKTYSRRICDKVCAIIDESQGAYLKGRLITNNVRSMAATIRLANAEESIDGVLVSLDAKKAFDSVEHGYIEKVLEKFGLKTFIPIFRLLYSDLESSILINGKITPGFRILRGVKQGDSLSCVLFIMCMEPLIRNIEANGAIEAIESRGLGPLPKAYAYADDVNAAFKRKLSCLQAVFDEYTRLTRWSGLQLNADKTEILSFHSRNVRIGNLDLGFDIEYMAMLYHLECKDKVKINGIIFQQNESRMRIENLESILKKVESQLLRWSGRGLSLLGKILVLKTFGISQVIYLMRSITLESCDIKRLKSAMYKFLWNKRYLAAKAPERIKREIVNKPIELGGFGMLDLTELDEAIKIRTIGIMLDTKHPLLTKLMARVKLDDFFHPNFDQKIDLYISTGVKLIGEARRKCLLDDRLTTNSKILTLLGESRIRNWIKREARDSITLFDLRLRGINKIRDLRIEDFDRIKPLLEEELLKDRLEAVIPMVRRLNLTVNLEDLKLYPINGVLKQLSKCSTKEIRTSRMSKEQICNFKIGLELTPTVSKTWLNTARRLTSVKHRSVLLRVAHAEIYSKERLFRFGMAIDPNCEHCGLVETVCHKLFQCERVVHFWRILNRATEATLTMVDPNLTGIYRNMGAFLNINRETLTLNAELLSILTGSVQGRPEPISFIKNMIKNLIRKEGHPETKEKIAEILENLTED